MTRIKKRPRLQSFFPLLCAVTCFSGILIALFVTVRNIVSGHHHVSAGPLYTNVSDIPVVFDAVLVLGGGAPLAWNQPPIYVQRRLDDALLVVRPNRTPILCLSAGTAHVPQLLSPNGLPVWESTASAAYVLERDPGRDIFVETTSYDTIGNAFYARTTHTDVKHWKKLLIVTNEFHMKRTRAIFDWVFSLPGPINYELHYLQSQNTGLSQEALNARQEKESNGLESVKRLAAKIKTLEKLWNFLNRSHGLYTAEKLVTRARDTSKGQSALIRKSYGGR